jgi:hypothetical protein
MSSSSKKKEPRCACLIEAKAWHRQNVGRGLILCTTLPVQWTVCQPHQMEEPTQGVVPGKKSGNHPGLSPSKGQKPNPGTPTGPGYQLPRPSLDKTTWRSWYVVWNFWRVGNLKCFEVALRNKVCGNKYMYIYISNEIQLYYLDFYFKNSTRSSTCFGHSPCPSSGVTLLHRQLIV